jgi:NitT/TauT family transport system ATP-binding protein
MKNDILLNASHLKKSFQAENSLLEVLADISFSVAGGEFICLVGPSGCGKSTLLRILAGLLPADQGLVTFKGQAYSSPQPEIGLVFQQSNLMPWRTVLANVLLPLELQGVPAEKAREQGMEALSLVGLQDFVMAYPRDLSGGMAQRVGIARAMVQKPQLLLLDEPFGALDALSREKLNRELLNLWEIARMTAVMVTHDIREAVFLADRVIILSQRPAGIAAETVVDLPRPRTEALFYSEALNALTYDIRQAIH